MPDYCAFGKCLGDGGADWERTIQTSGKNLSLAFEHPNISGRKDYETLTCAVSKAQRRQLSQKFETFVKTKFPFKLTRLIFISGGFIQAVLYHPYCPCPKFILSNIYTVQNHGVRSANLKRIRDGQLRCAQFIYARPGIDRSARECPMVTALRRRPKYRVQVISDSLS